MSWRYLLLVPIFLVLPGVASSQERPERERLAPDRAIAQGGGPVVSLVAGSEYTSRHLGLTLEAGVSAGSGILVHHGGVSGSFAPTAGLDVCNLTEMGGGCVDEEWTLYTAFYEPRLRLVREGPLLPYVGGRVSAVRGWNGVGWGAGAVAGVETGGVGGPVWRVSALLDFLSTEAAGPSGYAWDSARFGVRIGFGWQFEKPRLTGR